MYTPSVPSENLAGKKNYLLSKWVFAHLVPLVERICAAHEADDKASLTAGLWRDATLWPQCGRQFRRVKGEVQSQDVLVLVNDGWIHERLFKRR